jgi:hypothetical protein
MGCIMSFVVTTVLSLPSLKSLQPTYRQMFRLFRLLRSAWRFRMPLSSSGMPAGFGSLIFIALSLSTNVSAQTITVPGSTATGIGLAAAGQYQVLSDNQWTDYENVIIIAVLNELTKTASNTGQPIGTGEYNSIASLVRAQLDGNAPSAAKFQSQDEASRLRYAIDLLPPIATSSQAGTLLPQVLVALEATKFSQLELVFNPSLYTPADLGYMP